ncbi:GNAT family N-acetyltransferase [Rhodococcus fascians]|nr:GNAT family N-acetyltransferase [Rhodococcus fascians]MBY4237517.1 GNAT family N-acetyltransferase [Rhodococcus fascians]MBY4253196.1 GNAT family N-acetyltransferase [Rhodococcus fascians]MBY4268564.1 GNAT family N-acetyltransferase [Rhodococcus fascians]
MIRRRVDEDLPACVSVLAAVHEADGYPAVWPTDPQGWLSSDAQVAAWVFLDDRDIEGHLAVDETESALVLSRLFVAPESRGTGASSALLDVAVAYAAERSRALELHVERGSTAAIALYEKSGWIRTGTAPADWVLPDGRRAVEHRYVPGR